MKDKTNLSTTGANGAATPPRSGPAPIMLPDGDFLAILQAWEKELENSPASRPEMVARAKALIANPDYPSAGILSAVSRRLASALRRKNQ